MAAAPSMRAGTAPLGESSALQERRASGRAATCSSSTAAPDRSVRRRQRRRECVAAYAQLRGAAAERLGIAERDASSDMDTGGVLSGVWLDSLVTNIPMTVRRHGLGCGWQGVYLAKLTFECGSRGS